MAEEKIVNSNYFTDKHFWQFSHILLDTLRIKTCYVFTLLWWVKDEDLCDYKKEAIEYLEMPITHISKYNLCYKKIDYVEATKVGVCEKFLGGKIMYFCEKREHIKYFENFLCFWADMYYSYMYHIDRILKLEKDKKVLLRHLEDYKEELLILLKDYVGRYYS